MSADPREQASFLDHFDETQSDLAFASLFAAVSVTEDPVPLFCRERARFLKASSVLEKVIHKLQDRRVTELRHYIMDTYATAFRLKIELHDISVAVAALIIACRDRRLEIPRERLIYVSGLSQLQIATALFEVSVQLPLKRREWSAHGYAKHLGRSVVLSVDSIQRINRATSIAIALDLVDGEIPTVASAACYLLALEFMQSSKPSKSVIAAKKAKAKSNIYAAAVSAKVPMIAAEFDETIEVMTPLYDFLVTDAASLSQHSTIKTFEVCLAVANYVMRSSHVATDDSHLCRSLRVGSLPRSPMALLVALRVAD